jgi:hypothetical protein
LGWLPLARGLLPRGRIGEHDIAHLVVALNHPDGVLEKGIAEGGINDIWRIVAQHFSHVIGEDIAVDVLEPDHVRFGKIGAVALIEGFDDF